MSPLQQVRADLNLSIGEAAAACGVSYWSWHRAERCGAGVPRQVRVALTALGFDGEAVARRQTQWQQEEAQRLQCELADRMGGGVAAAVGAGGVA